MKLVTFLHKSRTRVGVLEEDGIHSLTWNYDMLRLIQSGVTPKVLIERAPLKEAELKLPYVPSKVIGIGRNYAAHAEELNNELPAAPMIFAKLNTSLVASGETITWKQSLSAEVDWEGELAVIIGKRARNVSEADAMNHVFGYTIANDITARDVQGAGDWIRGKGMDTFCPFGPCIVTRDEIPDPHNLTIITTVNGEEKQNGSTSLMMFKIPYLVSYLSQAFTLEPGDVILTGTPSGVGKGMNPPQFLKTGDEVCITIEGIGQLCNPCKAE